jgi:hypothetical protein
MKRHFQSLSLQEKELALPPEGNKVVIVIQWKNQKTRIKKVDVAYRPRLCCSHGRM